jgi:hypothetical protein
MKAMLIFLALCGAAWSSHAEEFVMKPMDAATVSQARESARQHCAESQKKATVAVSEFEIAVARQSVAVACDCMPTQIEETAKTFKGIGLIGADASRLHTAAVEVCAARQFRSMAPSFCGEEAKKDQTIKDKAAYCACFGEQVGRLTDEQIIDMSKHAYRAFQAKGQAQMKGEPDPPEDPSTTGKIDKACRAAR